jgi:hypothetical protein
VPNVLTANAAHSHPKSRPSLTPPRTIAGMKAHGPDTYDRSVSETIPGAVRRRLRRRGAVPSGPCGNVVDGSAFYDSIAFDELWERVTA